MYLLRVRWAGKVRLSCAKMPTWKRRPNRQLINTMTQGKCALLAPVSLFTKQVADEFLDRFVRYKNKHVLGDPRDEKTTIAPLVHPEHLKRVDGFIKRARENGDRIMFGGAPFEGLVVRADLGDSALE